AKSIIWLTTVARKNVTVTCGPRSYLLRGQAGMLHLRSRDFRGRNIDVPSARGAAATTRLPIKRGQVRRALTMARTPAMPALKAESGLSQYLDEIRRFPMLEPQEEYMLARSWREHGDREAAHKLVTSHLRLVAKIAMGYRGYGLPISEVVSEGNVGLMQAVKR